MVKFTEFLGKPSYINSLFIDVTYCILKQVLKMCPLILRHSGHPVNVGPKDCLMFFIQIFNILHFVVSLSFPSVCCYVCINAVFQTSL
jgi:hypothetical protein